MRDVDPLDLLTVSLDRPVAPDPEFADRLLDELLARLHDGAPWSPRRDDPTEATDEREIVHISTASRSEVTGPDRRWRRAVAAAAALALVGAGLVSMIAGDGDTVTMTGQPAPDGRLDLVTARALLDGAGGADGLEIAMIPAERPTTLVSFDPLDPDRVLIGDLIGHSPDLWRIDDGRATRGRLPWVEDQEGSWQGGIFQRDGSIVVYDGGQSSPTDVILLDNAGRLTAVRDIGAEPSYLPVAEGEIAFTLTTDAKWCPYKTVVLAGPSGPVTLDDRLGAFVRTDIPQPGVGVAYPHLGPRDRCDPPASDVAVVWDLATGERLVDHPLDGRAIARAAISADGRRAMVMDPDGVVSILDMASGATLATLGTFDSRYVLTPLAVNDDGTIAVVTEDTGRTTVWHADTATRLLEVTSDLSALHPGREREAVGPGAGVAYDGSRVAILDAGAGVWRILTLDPNDWAALACDAGAGVSVRDLAGRGLDPGASC